MHFTCSLQNVGQKKVVAWNDRAIKGEEALWGKIQFCDYEIQQASDSSSLQQGVGVGIQSGTTGDVLVMFI